VVISRKETAFVIDRRNQQPRWRQATIRGAALAASGAAYVGAASWVMSTRLGVMMDSTNSVWEPAPDEPITDPLDHDYRGDPGEALGFPYDEVMIPTELGDAPAWFVPGSGSTWVIFVHGIGGAREHGFRHLSVMHPAGWPVLLISYRNDPVAPADPGGQYTFGLKEWHDLDAAVQYALANGAERIILDGESMGGAIIGEFLKRSRQTERVSAVILDAPALDMVSVSRSYIRQTKAPLAEPITQVGLWMAHRRFEVPVGDARSVDEVATFDRPLFLAHGTADTLVPIDISYEVVTRRTGPTTFLRSGAEHVRSWYEDPDRYRAWLQGFLATVGQ
jgi:fermentation-respiration switch protein FrsA (DUF1100 family)